MKIKQEESVKIKLKTVTMIDGQKEEFAFEEAGRLVTLNAHQHYLTYTEHQAGQVVPVRIRLDEGQLMVTRDGARRTRLHFDPEQSTQTRYRTEYGVINLEVFTDRLLSLIDIEQANGTLRIDYRLKNGPMILGKYHLDLTFRR
ncbi:MAG TPA: DUF1934 domain-containing protein [Candidatus Limosilactobacillus faecipullorum]|nr:DUF1934 domain-containing protein [Candidatus Limosilactobacillus faecipullorum]